MQRGHRGTVRPALGTGRQLDLNSGVLLLPTLIACAQTAAIDATGSGVGGVRVGWDPRPLRTTGALLQSMLRWQVADLFSFQRRLTAARRRPAPARRPHRRPVPELTDGSGCDPSSDYTCRAQIKNVYHHWLLLKGGVQFSGMPLSVPLPTFLSQFPAGAATIVLDNASIH